MCKLAKHHFPVEPSGVTGPRSQLVNVNGTWMYLTIGICTPNKDSVPCIDQTLQARLKFAIQTDLNNIPQLLDSSTKTTKYVFHHQSHCRIPMLDYCVSLHSPSLKWLPCRHFIDWNWTIIDQSIHHLQI